MIKFSEFLEAQSLDPALTALAVGACEAWDRDGGEAAIGDWAKDLAPRFGFSRSADVGGKVESLHSEWRASIRTPAAPNAVEAFRPWVRGQYIAAQIAARAILAWEYWVVTGDGVIEDWALAAARTCKVPVADRQAAADAVAALVARYRSLGGTIARPSDLASLLHQVTPDFMAAEARRHAAQHKAEAHFWSLLSAAGRTSRDVRRGEYELTTADGRIWAVRRDTTAGGGSTSYVDGDRVIGDTRLSGGDAVGLSVHSTWTPGPDAADVTAGDVAPAPAPTPAPQAPPAQSGMSQWDFNCAANRVAKRRPSLNLRGVPGWQQGQPEWRAAQVATCQTLLAELEALGEPPTELSATVRGDVQAEILADLKRYTPSASGPAPVKTAPQAPAPAPPRPAPLNGLGSALDALGL